MFAWSWNPIDWIKGGIGKLAGLVGDAANGLLGDIFEWLSSLLLRGVIWLFGVIFDFISKSTTPNLAASWFQDGPMATARWVGAMLVVLFVILAIAEAVWNRDGGQLLRSLGQDAPKVIVLTLGLTAFTSVGLVAADGVTVMFMELFGENIETFTTTMASITSELSFGAGVLVIVLMALFLIVVLLFVAVELIVRESFVLILVPICAVLISTEMYRPTKGMGSRSTRLLMTTIAAKPMIALCLAVGAAALGQQAIDTEVDAVAEPATGPREITEEQLTSWYEVELDRCVVGMAASTDALQVQALANLIDGAAETDVLKEHCRDEIVVAERCCDALDFSAPAVLRSDPWRETVVTGSSDDIDGVDTSAVAPTFGLVTAGLATMVLAAFSPFLLMRLISTDPGASTGDARSAIGGSIGTAKSSVTKAGSRIGALAKKAGG